MKYFAEELLHEYKACHLYSAMEQQMPSKSHRHAETDTQIPLHILISFEYKTLTHIALNLDIDSGILIFLLFCWT